MMHTEKPEYDDIASKYTTDAERRGDRVCVFAPSAQHYLGDVSNKSLLELACGSGYFTRLIKGWGAQRLVGVDLSNEMISSRWPKSPRHLWASSTGLVTWQP
jgi:trans-aconitate methyltransferase